MRDARRAGKKLASPATAASDSAADPRIAGSAASTPNSSDDSKREAAKAAARPTLMPIRASRGALADDHPNHLAGRSTQSQPDSNGQIPAFPLGDGVRNDAVYPDGCE